MPLPSECLRFAARWLTSGAMQRRLSMGFARFGTLSISSFLASVGNDVCTGDADGCASRRNLRQRRLAYSVPSYISLYRPVPASTPYLWPIRPSSIQSVALSSSSACAERHGASPSVALQALVEQVMKPTRCPITPDGLISGLTWTHSCPPGTSPHRRPV